MNPLSALSHGLASVERWASRLLVVGFVALIVANVTMRYAVGRPLIFAEELAAILLVWLAFVSVSISIHDRAQIGVTLLTDRMPARMRQVVDAVVLALVAAMLGTLLWFSVKWVNSPAVEFEQIITTGWAKAPFFWIVPVFCVTALVHVLADLWESVTTDHGVEIAQSKGLEI